MADNYIDLPLHNLPGSRIFGFLVGALIYAAVTLLSIAAISDTIVRYFESQPALLTVALPPALPTPEALAQTDKIVDLLRDVEGVVFVSALEPQRTRRLIDPLVGGSDIGLAVPRLLDIGFSAGNKLELAAIKDQLLELTPGLALGDTVMPGGEILPLASSSRMLSLIGGGASLVLTFIATGLAIGIAMARHADSVGLLRQMGATDGYIARQFEHYALVQGLKGAAFGFALGAATMATGLLIFGATTTQTITTFGLQPLDWVFLALIPALVGLLIVPVARLVAHWQLRSLEA